MVDTELKKCPRCGNPAAGLIDIDAGKRIILTEAKLADASNLPAQVCGTCYAQITALVSKGAKLRLDSQTREKNRHLMWKARVNLVKQARALMQQRAYPEAAVTYEKYLRVLEMSYDLKPGMLKPDVFGKSSRSKELTVIATTYWDLMRIYDTNPNYRDRMAKASQKLAEFLPYSPIFPDVTAKAQQYVSSAKNPDVVRNFLKLVKASSKRCFVATAAFESEDHPAVQALRDYRDRHLASTRLGRALIESYYLLSPPLARFLDHSPNARVVARKVITKIAQSLDKNLEN